MSSCFKSQYKTRSKYWEDGGPYGRIPADLALALDKRLSFISEDKKGVSVVELVKREGSTLGLIISGGINRGSRPKISNLRPGSVAHRSDALAVGDHLVAVNSIRTARLKHEEIVNLLKNAGDRVTLEVEYEIPDSTESSLCACPKIIQVKLEKENGSFGFTLRGGACPDKLKCRPLVITHVRPGGPADREGTIKSGDRLLAIDGLNLSSASLQEAMEVLKSVEKEAIISVEYDVSLMDAVRNASGPLLVEIDRAPGTQLGITLTRIPGQRAEGPMVIESIKQASLAERCGALHVGDHILAVDGTRVDHMTPAEAIQLLRTAGGSTVKLELLPVSQMVTRRNHGHAHDHSGMRVAHLPSSGPSYNPYNTLSSYGGHSSSSSVCFPTTSGSPGATCTSYAVTQPHSQAKERPTNYRRIPRFLPAFPSTASLSSSAATAVLSCGQLCHTETTEVILHADQRGFGFTLQGSNFASDMGSHPVISQIDPGGAADRCGVVQIGDRLISVNGQSTEGLSLTEVVQLIQRSAPRVVLLIEFDVAESVVPSSGTFMVKLARGIAGLGITITSAKNRKAGEPLILSDIKKGSAAHRTGTLQPGDRLLAIDSVRTDHCTIEDAAEILQACESGVVKLRIKKDDTFADPDSSRGAVVFTVELVRHGGPLGITISGTEEPFEPVIISGLTDGGLAEKTGALHVGDHLLAINGCSLRGKPLSEAILLLQNSGDVVTLKIAKFPSPNKKGQDSSGDSSKKQSSDAVTDRENNFVSPYVSQPLPSVDSAVESWDSCGLDLLSGHECSKGEDHLRQFNTDRDSSSHTENASNWSKVECRSQGTEPRWDPQLPGDETAAQSEKLPQLWDDSNYVSPTSGRDDTADWSRVLEDLETCGQSQLLRQIEQSIMGSQTSLRSPTPTRVSVEFDEVLQRATANQRDDGYQDEGDDSSCQTTMIYSVNRPRTEELDRGEGMRPSTEVGFYHDPSGTTYGNAPVSIEVYRVTLFKDKVYEDFGFSVSDGLYERGVFVNRIREGGPADQSGILRRYDRILQVNNTRTHAHDCCLTVPLIASAGDCIELVISRPSYCNGVGREGMRPFLRSGNSDDSNQSGVTTHPWMDQSDVEDCSSPIPTSANGESSGLMTKTL